MSAIIDDDKRNILIRAPVKSGKREIVECISTVSDEDVKVIYITAFNRKDVKQQAEELETYSVDVVVVPSRADALLAVENIKYYVSAGKFVILCIDECDYGSGSRHNMSEVAEAFVSDSRIVKLWISATPEEVESSNMSVRDDYEFLEFNPPKEYIGAKYFIDSNLVFQPQKFFEKHANDVNITHHAIQVLRESITTQRNIGTVRVTGRDMPVALFKSEVWKRSIANQLKLAMSDGKIWEIEVIDAKSPFEWEHRRNRLGYTTDKNVNYLFILFQTCTRGTDLKGWHPHIAFWHDSRKGASLRASGCSNLNTLVQALLRVSHYTTMEGYGGVAQNIRIYADVAVMTYAANNDMGCYLGVGGKPPTRTSNGKMKKHVATYTFVECNADTYSDCANSGNLGSGGENPFIKKDESGMYLSCIRSKWKVRTYKEVVNEGWGINEKNKERRFPCYKDGVCGVAFAKYSHTETKDEHIVTSKTSMFQKHSKL